MAHVVAKLPACANYSYAFVLTKLAEFCRAYAAETETLCGWGSRPALRYSGRNSIGRAGSYGRSGANQLLLSAMNFTLRRNNR